VLDKGFGIAVQNVGMVNEIAFLFQFYLSTTRIKLY